VVQAATGRSRAFISFIGSYHAPLGSMSVSGAHRDDAHVSARGLVLLPYAGSVSISLQLDRVSCAVGLSVRDDLSRRSSVCDLHRALMSDGD